MCARLSLNPNRNAVDFLNKSHLSQRGTLRDLIFHYVRCGGIFSLDGTEAHIKPFTSPIGLSSVGIQEQLPDLDQDILLGLVRTRLSQRAGKQDGPQEGASFKFVGQRSGGKSDSVHEYLITYPKSSVVSPYDIYGAECGRGDGSDQLTSIESVGAVVAESGRIVSVKFYGVDLDVIASWGLSDTIGESDLRESLLISHCLAAPHSQCFGAALPEGSLQSGMSSHDRLSAVSFSRETGLSPTGEYDLDMFYAPLAGNFSHRELPYNVAVSQFFRTQLPADTDLDANLGAVYTPDMLASWVAHEMCQHLPAEGAVRLLDPAAGEGSLLKAVAAALRESVELVGVDVDPSALKQARAGLPTGTELYSADSLAPKAGLSAVEAWRDLLGVRPLTGIIANPPWGADVNHSRAELKALGYELANGQFDSYDLFIELCLSIAPEGAVLAFIVPDSIFYPEHESLRRLLLGSTRILSISRLGEGFFAGVFRGTAVVLARKGRPDAEHTISCMRLTKEWRQKILIGQGTLEQAKRELAHPVRQLRFEQDSNARFDIDVHEREEKVLVKMSEAKMPWTRWLVSGRGIELSKHGRVIVCPQCGVASPLPRYDNLRCFCRVCARFFVTGRGGQQQIVRPLQKPERDWQPLIVGEDVDRYRCFPSRQVRLNVTGINYKTSEIFTRRKLLIRKTGLGIKAAIDETGAYTNQVVFHYYVPTTVAAPPFLLDYLQGVLCSRVLLAYHLKRIGENEWRSHPYVTQQIIAELPIPDISEGSWEWRQAAAIADAVGRRRKVNSSESEEDLRVDRLVAGLYRLTEADCQWVLKVLDQADSLEPIRTLRLTERSALTPVRIA